LRTNHRTAQAFIGELKKTVLYIGFWPGTERREGSVVRREGRDAFRRLGKKKSSNLQELGGARNVDPRC